MSNTATMELPANASVISAIVETSRGPSIAGRGITVYAITEYLKDNLNHALIKKDFRLSDEQLSAVLQYITDHREEVERDYEEIVRYSEELRARYEPISRARSSFAPDMSNEEKDALLRRKLACKIQELLPKDENIHPA